MKIARHLLRLLRKPSWSLALGASVLLLPVRLAAAPVPSVLNYLGEAAEAAYDLSNAGQWAQAGAKTAAIKETFARLGGADASALASWAPPLNQLAESVASRNRLAAMEAANELTRLAAESSRSSILPYPVEVTLLDYLGRKLFLQIEKRDASGVKRAVVEIRATWNAAHPAIVARGGAQAAQAFESVVVSLEQSSDLKSTGRLDRQFLEEVDHLEAVFSARLGHHDGH